MACTACTSKSHDTTKRTLYDRVLLSMLDEAGARWPGLQTDNFYLGGFSGGGQFSHRFLYLHPERLLGVCIGAPGFVTLADESQPWPNGVNGMAEIFDKNVDFNAIQKVPTLVVCGEKDTGKDTFVVRDRVHGAIPGLGLGSAGAGLRTENVGLLAKSLRAKDVAVTLEYVPGVKHESVKVQPTMARFLAPLVEKQVAAK